MPGPYITTDDLAAEVAPILGYADPSLLPARAQALLEGAVEDGYADLMNILLGKGYTQDQLDSFDQRVRYNRDQSAFWFLTRARGVAEFDERGVPQLDHRKELTAVSTIMISGVPQVPSAAGAGQPTAGIGAGDMDSRAELFRRRR